MRIGYIIGSTAEGSVNQKLARVLVGQAPEQAEMVHIPIRHLPLYHRDMDDDFPQAMSDYKDQVAGVDGLLLVSPEHNQSFPAAVKNALDILTRPQGKNIIGGLPLGIAGASPGRFGTINGQSQLRQFLPPLGVKLMGSPVMAVQAARETFTDDGADEQTTRRAGSYMEAFAEFVARHR